MPFGKRKYGGKRGKGRARSFTKRNPRMLQADTMSGFFQNTGRAKGKQLLSFQSLVSPASVDVHAGSRMHTVKVLLNWHEVYATAMVKTWQRLKIKKVTLLIKLTGNDNSIDGVNFTFTLAKLIENVGISNDPVPSVSLNIPGAVSKL